MKNISGRAVIISTIICCLSISCDKKGAQYPSNKIQKIDSTEIKLQGYNQRLIQHEDSMLLALLLHQTQKFEKSKVGFWYYVQQKSDLQPLVNDSIAHISYKIYDMEGSMLDEKNDQTVHFGKKEIPTGLEEGLKLMKKGEIVRFVIPWYLAYGAQGAENIQPYTSLTIVVKSAE